MLYILYSQGDWVYNRIVVVECPNVIPDDKQDKHLVEHLLEEKDYIVSLAINELLEELFDYKPSLLGPHRI